MKRRPDFAICGPDRLEEGSIRVVYSIKSPLSCIPWKCFNSWSVIKKNDLSFPVRALMGCDTKESTLLGQTTACVGGLTHFHVLTPWLVVVMVPIFLLLVQTLESQHSLGRRTYLLNNNNNNNNNNNKVTEYDLGRRWSQFLRRR